PIRTAQIPSPSRASFFTPVLKGPTAMKEKKGSFHQTSRESFSTSKIPLSAYRFTEKENARALGWGRKERKEE
ncbi:hypothetical protein CI102_3208, partial [Trichoderma harzianum]